MYAGGSSRADRCAVVVKEPRIPIRGGCVVDQHGAQRGSGGSHYGLARRDLIPCRKDVRSAAMRSLATRMRRGDIALEPVDQARSALYQHESGGVTVVVRR